MENAPFFFSMMSKLDVENDKSYVTSFMIFVCMLGFFFLKKKKKKYLAYLIPVSFSGRKSYYYTI